MKWLKHAWVWLTRPTPLLSILLILIVIVIVAVSLAWSLGLEQVLALAIAVFAFPVALLTQRAILIENQKHELARRGYDALQKPIDRIRESLVEISQTDLDNVGPLVIVNHGIKLRKSVADFTDTFHYHEMIFGKKAAIQVEFLHFTMMKLAFLLDHTSSNVVAISNAYTDEAREAMKQAKELTLDLAGYMHDLNKELIEDLGFDKIFNTVITKRRPKDGSKTLPKVATKNALKALKQELGMD